MFRLLNTDRKIENSNIKTPLRRGMLAAMLLVIMIAGTGEALVQYAISRITSHADVINISGRQRMLSQLITKEVLLIAYELPSDITRTRQRIAFAFDELTQNHQRLTAIDDSIWVGAAIKVSQRYKKLSVYYVNMVDVLMLFNRLTDQQLTLDDPQFSHVLNTLLDNEREFLTIMNQIVFQYAQQSTRQVSQLRIVSVFLYGVLVVAVVLISLLAVRPLLRKVIASYRKIEYQKSKLEGVNEQLNELVDELSQTQVMLLDAEKNSLLTSAIGGISHDVSTPLGICITTTSHLQDKLNQLSELVNSETIKKSELLAFIEGAGEGLKLQQSNLARARDLMSNFKQIAVDHGCAESREINLGFYLDDIVMSLTPRLRKTDHEIFINCPKDIIFDSYPFAFYQIFTNLIINSLIHGFENMRSGKIFIDVNYYQGQLNILYQDNGCGFGKGIREKIFEPFFTTKKGQGGSGLGTHIVYQLVTEQLAGEISCESDTDAGVCFTINIPVQLKS